MVISVDIVVVAAVAVIVDVAIVYLFLFFFFLLLLLVLWKLLPVVCAVVDFAVVVAPPSFQDCRSFAYTHWTFHPAHPSLTTRPGPPPSLRYDGTTIIAMNTFVYHPFESCFIPFIRPSFSISLICLPFEGYY